MPVIKIPDILRQKLTESGTDALIGVLNQVEQSSKENAIGIVTERFETRLSQETSRLDKRVTEESARLDNRITAECAKLDRRITEESARLDRRITEEFGSLRALIAEREVRTLRWLVALWIPQMAATVGLFLRIK